MRPRSATGGFCTGTPKTADMYSVSGALGANLASRIGHPGTGGGGVEKPKNAKWEMGNNGKWEMGKRENPQNGKQGGSGTPAGEPTGLRQRGRPGGVAAVLRRQIASDGAVEHFYGRVSRSSRLHSLFFGAAGEVAPAPLPGSPPGFASGGARAEWRRF